MKRFPVLAAGALAAALALAAGSLGADPRPVAAPVADGGPCTVNIGRVFQAIPRARKLDEDLKAEGEQLQTAMDQREQELRKQIQDLEARLSAGTPEYELERKKIEMRIAELQYDRKREIEGLRRKQVTGMAAVYREIAAEAERIASEKGYAMVLTVDEEPITVEERGQVIGGNDLKLQIALRTVVWADGSSDITKDVIDALMPK